ncbi:MAG: hypothetical protein AABN34_01290 [Acidobacteriota bacterium]
MAGLHTQIEEDAATGSSAARSGVPPVRKRRRIILKLLLAIIVALLAYTAFDLLAPRSSRMRSFDPNEVARLETAMGHPLARHPGNHLTPSCNVSRSLRCESPR